MLQKRFPAVTVSGPAANCLHAGETGSAHGLLNEGVIGEALQTIGEGGGVADGDDVALLTVGEEVFAACGCGADNGAAAGECLGLDKSEPFFDGGQDENVAARHEGG